MYNELTEVDIRKMQEEIDYRMRVVRPKCVADLKTAREFGDLSENYEYKAAKQAQRQNDSRMRYLQNMIKTAQIIDEDAQKGGVQLFDRVTLWLPEDEEEMTVQVVSTVRTDPSQGRVSLESPLGKALLGAKLGDIINVHVSESYSYDAEIRAVEPAEDDGSAPLLPY